MKKSFFTLMMCAVAMGTGFAQYTEVTTLQPAEVVSRRFDESGQLIKETTSSFTYNDAGKLTDYKFPSHSLTSTYAYNGNYLAEEYVTHMSGHPVYSELLSYSYESGKLTAKSHTWSQLNAPEHWLYTYNREGWLERMDYCESYNVEYHEHYLYEYEDGGRKKIESYYTSYTDYILKSRTEYEYDEAFALLSERKEKYNASGEVTQTTLTTHTYTPSGKKETEVTQTLSDGEWVNTDIVRYVYDDSDRVTEWQVGAWSDETGDWVLTHRTTYEYDLENYKLTVSFYRNVDGEWKWDWYEMLHSKVQPLFFEPHLKEVEHALRYYGYDDLFGSEYVSQFEFTMVETERPTYEDVAELTLLRCGIYPNPGHDQMKVEADAVNAVIRVYNTQGQLVMAKPFAFSTEIDAAGWSAGMYVWEIWVDSQKQAAGKWVKE